MSIKTVEIPSEFVNVLYPDKSAVSPLKKWLRQQRSRNYIDTIYVKLYHGTHSSLPILEQGLLPTNEERRRSLQSGRGYVYLATAPWRARDFGTFAYPGETEEIAVYAVVVSIRSLIPDKDQLANKRRVSEGQEIGSSLADSLLYGGGARVKGAIAPWQISKLDDMMG